MTQRDEYSDEEWASLVGAPVAVIAAVIGASPNGPVGIAQEVQAAVRSFEQAAETRRDNPLIAALLLTLKERFEAFGGKQPEDAAAEQVDIFALGSDRERALATVAAAGALLAQRVPADVAAEVRAWLRELAEAVANAASEGGFLGIGGEQVSPKEREVVAAIDAALAPPAG
jgi:hypothetical protein